MNICKIKEVCQVNPPKKIPLSQDTDISFVPMSAVSTDGKVDLSKVITVEKVKSLSVFKDGDVIFAKITPCMENGKGAVVSNLKNGYGAGSTEFTVLRPNETHISEKWLYYYLSQKHFRRTCQQNMTGSAGQKRVPAKYLAECLIPVPPLEEQQRIVARIEELFSELDAAVATLERTKEQLAVYRQAVLKEAFEEISEFVTLQSISEKIFDGPFGSNLKTADYTTSGIRVVRLENLKNGWFDDSKQSFVTSDKYEKISSHTVYPTDLIMSTFISDAIKVCQLPEYIEYAVNKADCVGIRLKESVNQRYVMYYLLTQQAFSSLEHNVHGATRPRVNTTHIKEINVPICDRKKQNQIVSEVESRLSVCDKIEETVNTALQEAEAMRQSILKQAFSGEL